jgi:hypothetical protein
VCRLAHLPPFDLPGPVNRPPAAAPGADDYLPPGAHQKPGRTSGCADGPLIGFVNHPLIGMRHHRRGSLIAAGERT